MGGLSILLELIGRYLLTLLAFLGNGAHSTDEA